MQSMIKYSCAIKQIISINTFLWIPYASIIDILVASQLFRLLVHINLLLLYEILVFVS